MVKKLIACLLTNHLEDAIEFFDQGMKKLKTKTYSESFWFNYPKSKYFQ